VEKLSGQALLGLKQEGWEAAVVSGALGSAPQTDGVGGWSA